MIPDATGRREHPQGGGKPGGFFVEFSSRPFSVADAAHLMRRAGLGDSPDGARRLSAMGVPAAVDSLVNAPPDANEPAWAALLDAVAPAGNIEHLRTWWMSRMLQTTDPFREKIALFLHGHFATAGRKVDSFAAMRGQLEIFHSAGRGSFSDTTKQVITSAAMLLFLDGAKSSRTRPNENLARELMELFTLGRGNYSESDIFEAARGLTGWRVDGAGARFHAPSFDDTPRTIFGKSGVFDAAGVVDLCISNPACAPFISRKLLRFFVTPDPSAEAVAALARLLVETGFHLARSLAVVFKSEYFYSQMVRRSLIKSPVELIAGAIRTTGARLPPSAASAAAASMGQQLLDPPGVKGWDGHESWIHSATWFARVQFADELSRATVAFAGDPIEIFMLQDLPEPVRAQLLQNLKGAGVPAAVRAVCALPEFHCC